MKNVIKHNYKLISKVFIVTLILFILAHLSHILKYQWDDIAALDIQDYGSLFGYIMGIILSFVALSIIIVLIWRVSQYVYKRLRQ